MGRRINLIDTPGHVDFTVEVERCLRVLDGVVTVIDSSAGVQAQTLTVWRQSKEFAIPSIFFLNKIDKGNSDYNMAVRSIENKLDINVVPLTVQLRGEKKCEGILDIMNGKILEKFDSTQWIEINKDKHKEYYDFYLNEKENMISKIVEGNNALSEELLNNGIESFNKDILKSELRQQTLQKKLYPLGVGSALNSTMSVFPILDMIVDYLPTPDERNLLSKKVFNDKMSSLVFKIGHDDKLGQLFYTRIYTGTLKTNSTPYNGNKQEYEGKIKLYTPYSDEFVPVPSIGEGNIAVITGLKETRTGESLFEDAKCFKDGVKNLRNAISDGTIPGVEKTFILENENGNGVVYLGINPPDPVFFCTIEPPSQALMKKFEMALEEICKEDPSIKIGYDKDSGETILEAMGILHIEIIKDLLKRHYGLDVYLGKLRVSYREVITSEVADRTFVEASFGEGSRKQSCEIGMRIVPKKGIGKFKNIKVMLAAEDQNSLFHNSIRPDWHKAINAGCINCLHNGPLLGSPVEDIEIVVTNFSTSGNKTSASLVSAAANECLKKCLSQSEVKLTEPYVKLNVCVYDDAAESSVSTILHELNKRRAEVLDVKGETTGSNNHKIINITAFMPLIETTDLSKAIRTAASGMVTYSFNIEGYQFVSDFETNKLISGR